MKRTTKRRDRRTDDQIYRVNDEIDAAEKRLDALYLRRAAYTLVTTPGGTWSYCACGRRYMHGTPKDATNACRHCRRKADTLHHVEGYLAASPEDVRRLYGCARPPHVEEGERERLAELHAFFARVGFVPAKSTVYDLCGD